MTQDDPARERVKRYVENVRDFHYHLMTYVLVNAVLVVVDLRAGGAGDVFGLDWAYWIIIFWGFGIAGHAIYAHFGEYRVDKLYARLKGGEPRGG